MKRRVVITGMGVLSSIGSDLESITTNLKNGYSGIEPVTEWQELGLTSTIAGKILDLDKKIESAEIPRKKKQTMSNTALYAVLAAQDAISQSGLSAKELSGTNCGCLVGSGVGDVDATGELYKRLSQGKARRINPYTVVKAMASTCSTNIANIIAVGGRSYSIGSACATAAHNIGHAYELIQGGLMDAAIAGGAEEISAITTSGFCAMRALSTRYNDNPAKASRPYDSERDGFVISGGAGVITVEELSYAKARGAEILAEIIGYDANSDGYDVFLPEPEGKMTSVCMQTAMEKAGIKPADIDYINPHGTGTPMGDPAEINGLRKVFGDKIPPISSTKSMTGHPVGAAGGIEIIFCTQMMRENFIAPSINIDKLDPVFENVPIVRETRECELDTVLSNSFGFGGTNGSLILRKYRD